METVCAKKDLEHEAVWTVKTTAGGTTNPENLSMNADESHWKGRQMIPHRPEYFQRFLLQELNGLKRMALKPRQPGDNSGLNKKQ